jgi:uncharacterized protein
MTSGWRSTALFAAGSIAGAIVVLGAYLHWFQVAPMPVRQPMRSFAVAPAPPVPTTPTPVVAASTCPSQALAATTGERDGQFRLDAVGASSAQADASAFLAVAREAADEGRQRDAEVAYIAACRIAEQASGARSAPLADVKSLMGQHYVQLAAREGGDEARQGLLQRASSLFSESAGAYAAALGRNASKTRMAEQRLASVNEPASAHEGSSVMGAARETAPERPQRATGSAPLLVRSDPELAQLDADLGRLGAQAASVSRDPAGLQQRTARARAQRDSACQDKACLLRWYAQRRNQLLNEF